MNRPTTDFPRRITRFFRANRCGMSGLFVLLIAVGTAHAADRESQASSIQEFLEAKERWPQLVNQPLRIEGRFTVFSGKEVRFANCDVRFLSQSKLTRPSGESTNVEVSGHLSREDGKYVFHVRSLYGRPTDIERLKLDRLVMDSSQPEAHYKLAEWAHARGTFYEDEPLKQAARDLFRDGLLRANETLAPDDADGLRDLAARVTTFGLEDRLRLRFLHEAARAEFETASQKEQPKYAAIAARISRELPGSQTPLTGDFQTLRNDYEQAPRAVYRVADDATRRRLDRLFYAKVVLVDIEAAAVEDGRNGYAMADRIAQELPEFSATADDYRVKELSYLEAHLGQLTRQQLLDLAAKHEARQEPEQVTNVKRRWLKLREEPAKVDGPRGLMELGEEYLNLLQDERGAARMFQLAYAANPQLTTASDWLVDHGYQLIQGKWSRPGETPMTEDDELAEAIREGRPQKGMTGEQVRASLGSAPTSLVRIASAGRISEVWHFAELGISVQLSRRSHETELTVQRVTDAP